MKFLTALVIALIVILAAISFFASGSGNQLAYGDTTSGILSQQVPIWSYEFDGALGDIVVAELILPNPDEYPGAWLTMIRMEDENFWGISISYEGRPAVLGRLDEAGRYLVYIEGDGSWYMRKKVPFDLSLHQIDIEALDTAWEGSLEGYVQSTAHLFYAEDDGVYRVSMGKPGEVNPGLRISALTGQANRLSEIAEISLPTRDEFRMEIELEGKITYLVQVYRPYYTNTPPNIPYNVSIAPVMEPSAAAQR